MLPSEVNIEDHDLDLPAIDYDLFKGWGGQSYSVGDMIRVCAYSTIYPSSTKIEKLTGVPSRTIRKWRQKAPWWKELTRQIRKHKQEELDAQLTSVVMKASGDLLDRLEKGDQVLDKTGDLVTVPLKAMDVAKVLGIAYDKRALLRGDPTARTEKISTSEVLKELKTTFEAMAGKKPPEVIEDAEFEEVNDPDA